MASWQSLTHPIISPEISGLLPEEDWGNWVPDMGRRRGRRVDYTQKKEPMREVLCYHCNLRVTVPAAALSAICTHCMSHMQLQDFVLKSGTRRTKVHTQGNVIIASNACLARLNIVCQDLTMKGTGDGHIRCFGRLCIYSAPLMTQVVEAKLLDLKSSAHLTAQLGIRVENAEIRGELTGLIHATGEVHLHRGAVLRGDCRAAYLRMDAGAMHLGRFEQLERL